MQASGHLLGELYGEVVTTKTLDVGTGVGEVVGTMVFVGTDVGTVVGVASHPNILSQAGINETDLLIAVTDSDEINMIACQVASTIFQTPTKIARIRSKEYLDPKVSNLYGEKNIPIFILILDLTPRKIFSQRFTAPWIDIGTIGALPTVDKNTAPFLGFWRALLVCMPSG